MQSWSGPGAWILVLLTAATSAAAQAPQPPPLPTQDLVFVIDNSGSMTTTDPLRLRGVAAELILDAVEISSVVQAGLVIFEDRATVHADLGNDTTRVRQPLHPNRMPDAVGSTNMLDGLNAAIAMFSGSKADRKRIVLITDGAPNPGQGTGILQNSIPAAKAAGIEIFALGLSADVDQLFLDQVTSQTGGTTLIAAHHQQLLDLAKQLVGDRDNVYTLDKPSLLSDTMEYAFTLRSGVDRARITAMLDQPKEFAPGEIELELAGPQRGDERTYEINPGGANSVAAWTSFVSEPGDYRLRIKVTKPGATGHLGMRLILEALSDIRAELRLSPDATQRFFGDEVAVDVTAVTSSGATNAADLKVTGSVRTSSGGSAPIAFDGMRGTFKVPGVAGRQTVVVRVETTLAKVEVRAEYDAFAVPPPKLTSSRQFIRFANAFGPANPQVEESFKLFAEFPPGVPPRPVRFSFALVSPAGIAELVRGGNVLRGGVVSHVIPPGGLELLLRVRMDPKVRLPGKGGKYETQINITSAEATALTIPVEFDFRVPRFEVTGKREAFTLWWDPYRPRVVRLGSLHTDLASNSKFFVVIPEAIHAPDQGPKIADLALQTGSGPVEPERFEEGKLRYGPLELKAGDDFPLELLVTPTTVTGWEKLPASPRPIDVELTSELGMETAVAPVFWNVGGSFRRIPLLGTWSRHGRHWGTVLFVGLLLAIVISMAIRRIRLVRYYWPYRIGSILPFRLGAIQITDVDAGGAALVLPNSGSLLDNATVGHVYPDRNTQRVEDTSGQLVPTKARLGPGDPIAINDPRDPGGTETLWEIEYIDYDDQERVGEVLVTKSAAPWTVRRLLRWSFKTVIVLAAAAWLLGSGIAAWFAYRVLLFMELLYIRLLQP